MTERRTKGLYFNCDELFMPGYEYRPILFYIMPIMDEDDQKDEQVEEDLWENADKLMINKNLTSTINLIL